MKRLTNCQEESPVSEEPHTHIKSCETLKGSLTTCPSPLSGLNGTVGRFSSSSNTTCHHHQHHLPFNVGQLFKDPTMALSQEPRNHSNNTTQSHAVKHQVMKFSVCFLSGLFLFCFSAASADWSLGVESQPPAHHLYSDSGRIITPHKRPIVKT